MHLECASSLKAARSSFLSELLRKSYNYIICPMFLSLFAPDIVCVCYQLLARVPWKILPLNTTIFIYPERSNLADLVHRLRTLCVAHAIAASRLHLYYKRELCYQFINMKIDLSIRK